MPSALQISKILCFLALFAYTPTRVNGAALVTNETERLQALRAAFPQARVSVSLDKPLNWKLNRWPSHELTDALAGEKEYDVSGAVDSFEAPWALGLNDHDLITGPHENRRLRFRVYEVNAEGTRAKRYVALAHYKFVGIEDYPFCCEWFARLFVMTRQGNSWTAQHTDASLIYRAKTIRSFRLTDIDNDGREEILIEAENTATGYRRWIEMSLFTISDSRLLKLADIDTLSANDSNRTQYSLELNVAKTRQAAGKSLYFKSTVYGNEERQFPMPRVEEKVITPAFGQ